jgi:NitT/TauT family transport system substrate-binding protein
MQKKLLIIGVLLLCIAIVCAPWLNSLDDNKSHPPIRISISPNTVFELLHLAEKKGFFKDEGVSVKLIRLSALEDARRSYVRGQVDGMTGALTELIKARENGRESKILFVIDSSNGADVIIAHKGIKNISDLKGKKIAIEPESFGLSMLAGTLEKAGLSFNDVNLKGMNQLNIPQALLSGEIDAAHSYAPYSVSLLKNNPHISVIIDSSQIKDDIFDVLAIDPQVIKQRPDDMKAIKRAWDKAYAYSLAHPKEANLLMAEIENISQQDFTDDLKKTRIFTSADTSNLLKSGGAIEQSLIKVNSILHRENPPVEPLRISDYILPDNDNPGQ